MSVSIGAFAIVIAIANIGVITNANIGHLAGVLSAFADYYPILALGQAVMRIFCAITYLPSVNADLAVNGVRSMPVSA